MTIPEIVKKYTIRVNPNKSLCVRREILKHASRHTIEW